MDQFMGPYRGDDIDTIIHNMSQRPHIAALKKGIHYLVVDDGKNSLFGWLFDL
jgi:hypothetical protein